MVNSSSIKLPRYSQEETSLLRSPQCASKPLTIPGSFPSPYASDQGNTGRATGTKGPDVFPPPLFQVHDIRRTVVRNEDIRQNLRATIRASVGGVQLRARRSTKVT